VAALLDRDEVPYRALDLNLDEIFTAYVAGNRDGAVKEVEEAVEVNG
jgi:hypothetical protein